MKTNKQKKYKQTNNISVSTLDNDCTTEYMTTAKSQTSDTLVCYIVRMMPSMFATPETQLAYEQSIYNNIMDAVAPLTRAELLVCFDRERALSRAQTHKVAIEGGMRFYYRVFGMTHHLMQLQLGREELMNRHNITMLREFDNVHFVSMHGHVELTTGAVERLEAYFSAYRKNKTTPFPTTLPHVVYTMATADARPRNPRSYSIIATWWLLLSSIFLMYSKAWTWFLRHLLSCVTTTPLCFPGADVILYGEAPGNVRVPLVTRVGYLDGAIRKMEFETNWFRLGMDRLFYNGLNTFRLGNLAAYLTLYSPGVPAVYTLITKHLIHGAFWMSFLQYIPSSWVLSFSASHLYDLALSPPWKSLVFCIVVYTFYTYKLNRMARRVFSTDEPPPPSLPVLIVFWPISVSLFCITYPIAWILSWFSVGRPGTKNTRGQVHYNSSTLNDLF